jgi:hypothetical protein
MITRLRIAFPQGVTHEVASALEAMGFEVAGERVTLHPRGSHE